MKIKEFLSNYIKTFESNTLQYLKVNAIAVIIILVAIISLTVWLWPNEKQIDQNVLSKNTEIAKNIDENTLEYKDLRLGLKQELQLKEIQSAKKSYKLFSLGLYSVILIVLTGLLATLLQAIYTKLKFTDDAQSAQRVLSAALFSSALIVCVVFVVFYLQFYPTL